VREGYLGLVEYVSANEVFFSSSTTNSHRQIFGSTPQNMDEEDIVEHVSTVDLLKTQRACKAAAKKAAEDSETESESQTDPKTPSDDTPRASENPPPVENQPSSDFADEAAVPPGQCRKDVTRNNPRGGNTRHTPPVASTSAVPLRQAAPSEPLRGQASQASQQPRGHQTMSTQSLKPHSSPLGKSRCRKN
jgi:hypothetical protein